MLRSHSNLPLRRSSQLAPGSDFTAELGARIDRVTFDLEAHKAAEPQNALSARSSRQQSPTQAAITAHGGSCSSNHLSQSYAGSPAGSSANCASDQPIKPWEQEDAAAEGDVDEDAEDEIAFIRRIKQLHVETISNEKTPPFMGPVRLLLCAPYFSLCAEYIAIPRSHLASSFSRPFRTTEPGWLRGERGVLAWRHSSRI